MSLRYTNLDVEHNAIGWEWRMTDDGPRPFAIPRNCDCGQSACYGKDGKWYCLTHRMNR